MNRVPICNRCGNNMCYLYPSVFARKHLPSKQEAYYTGILDTAQKYLESLTSTQRTRYWREA